MHSATYASIDALQATAYVVPTDGPEGDGTLTWDSTTIVVCEVGAGDVTGLGYTYAHESCVPLIHDKLASVVRDRSALDVPGAWAAMRRSVRNLGSSGLVACAMSAVETALYDLKARLLDVPLSMLLGRVHERVPVYGSGGFTTYDDDRMRRQLDRWVGLGIPRVKIKIAESWGSDVERDLHRVRLARKVIGDDTDLYVDANGGYGVGQAVRVGRRLADEGVTWFEEPVSSDHLVGLRQVREEVAADVAAGEYGFGLFDFARLVDAQAVDCLQADVTRCGGYGEWLRAAALAAAQGLEVSGHCAPNLSAHVAAATENLRHLEYFHDHERIERMLFTGCLDPEEGALRPDPSVPGHGLALDRAAADPYRVR
jgi:L-alanine-DL-glutamate epimerase-like enolase superfamily enzyme